MLYPKGLDRPISIVVYTGGLCSNIADTIMYMYADEKTSKWITNVMKEDD